jgi:hypothetical protein
MKAKRNLFAAAVGLGGLAILVWLSTSIQGGEKTYELHPYVGVPEYRSDAARAIDAYERLMERYMDISESTLGMVGADLQIVLEKLDSIDGKLDGLSQRVARIEEALGIQPPPAAVQQAPDAPASKQGPVESSVPQTPDAQSSQR